MSLLMGMPVASDMRFTLLYDGAILPVSQFQYEALVTPIIFAASVRDRWFFHLQSASNFMQSPSSSTGHWRGASCPMRSWPFITPCDTRYVVGGNRTHASSRPVRTEPAGVLPSIAWFRGQLIQTRLPPLGFGPHGPSSGNQKRFRPGAFPYQGCRLDKSSGYPPSATLVPAGSELSTSPSSSVR